jgi:hypothetical protein
VERPTGASATPAEPQEAAPEEVRTPPQVSVDDVLREFQQDRPRAEPLLPASDLDAAYDKPGTGERDGSVLRLPDGYFLVDRTGRLAQEGEWWVFKFVSDNNPASAPNPPMRLLPNQMLERMIRESQGAGRGVEFIISGEVTDFMGENYVLLRKLMRKRDLGNLSK